MSWIELIKALIEAKFYGKVTINFQNGKIVNCVKEESIKLI
jgi:hypothetical protein